MNVTLSHDCFFTLDISEYLPSCVQSWYAMSFQGRNVEEKRDRRRAGATGGGCPPGRLRVQSGRL
jgi:hypothetical protein